MNFRIRINCFCLFVGFAALVSKSGLSISADDAESTFWSFRQVHQVATPAVRDHDWVATPVDAFVLARLEKQKLQPATAAGRRTLIRRATFDLTGLPPTPDEIDAFIGDESSDAFAKLVDRLLASPRYGERWGRHWLDVVRYADARDLIQLPAESDFREVWRYRDWVVASFNRDLPYDQFVARQVAGDLLQPANKTQIDADALVATGFLSIADFVPGDVDKQQMIADYVNDQIDVVGRAILGLTIGCARCHDHKFDPITTEDYYSLAGIFFSTRLIPSPVKGNTPLVRVPLLPPAEIAAIEAEQVRDKSRIAELTREVATFGEREYRPYLDRCIASETSKSLLALWEFNHPAAGTSQPSIADFATSRGLDLNKLTRWKAFVELPESSVLLQTILQTADRDSADRLSLDLVQGIAGFSDSRKVQFGDDAIAQKLAESAVLQFRADDRLLSKSDTGRITSWANRGRLPDNAVPVTDVPAPELVVSQINDQQRTVARFTGKELLQAPRTVPAAGSLIVAFRLDPMGGPGQRIVGWEDSAIGQHGIGIMTDAAGSLHVVVRKNGASGDVVVPAPTSVTSNSGYQIVCVTWGPKGIFVYRDGQSVGNNPSIDSISSDPSITALRIGGPGSGSSSRFQGDLAELRVYDQPLDDTERNRVEEQVASRWFSNTTPPASTNSIAELYDDLVSGQSPFRLEAAERDQALSDESRQRRSELQAELDTLKKKPVPDIPRAVVVQDGGPAETPHEGFRDAHVYIRGNHTNLGKTVPRGFPKFIEGSAPPVVREGSGRRELAEWLTRPENPLTARVMVNRIWQHHFGIGLVPTSANFGAMGETPSHPELLDYLAGQFIASGWSVKAMHRLIMLSNVYQQSSESNPAGYAADPENRLLWRANRRRLESEAIRDSLFAVAGRLDWTLGGPGFQEAATPRRSLYLMSVRTGAKTSEFGPLFDAPDCSGIVERRNESIVAPQALYLMNDPIMAVLATSLGDRATAEATSENDTNRIRRLYLIVLGRLPSAEENEIASQLLNDKTTPNAWVSFCRLLVCTNEFLFVD